MKTSNEDKKLKFRGMEKKIKSPLDFMNKKWGISILKICENGV
jgi:hypothetical protein